MPGNNGSYRGTHHRLLGGRWRTTLLTCCVALLALLWPREASSQPSTVAPSTGDAQLAVSCATASAQVFVDGMQIFVGPGSVKHRVRPGRHEVTATAPGALTDRRIIVVRAGETHTVSLAPQPMDSPIRQDRRWRASTPWIVGGSGVALMAVGAFLQYRSRVNFDDYGDAIATLCSESGCVEGDLPASVRNLESRAELQNKTALATGFVGAATMVTGLVMLYMNRPRGRVITNKPATTIGPVSTGRGAMVTSTLRF